MVDQAYSDLDQAKRDVLADYNGKASAMAPLIGIKNPKVLNNKVNPDMSSHGLMVDEAVAMQLIARDNRILFAEASILGFVCLPLPTSRLNQTSDTELLTLWAEWQKEIADAATAMHDALADGDIEGHEVARINREMHESFAKGMELLQRFEALAIPNREGGGRG